MPSGADKKRVYPRYRSFFSKFIFYIPIIFLDFIKKSFNGKGFKIRDDPLLIKTPASIKRGNSFPYNDPRRYLLCEGFSFSIKILDQFIKLAINHPHILELLLLKNFLCFCYIKTFEHLDKIIALEEESHRGSDNLGNTDIGVMVVNSCIHGTGKLVFNQFLVFIRCLDGERYAEVVVLLDVWFHKTKEFMTKSSTLKK